MPLIVGISSSRKSRIPNILKAVGKEEVLVLDESMIEKKFLKKGSAAHSFLAEMFPQVLDRKGGINMKKLRKALASADMPLGTLVKPFVVRAIRQGLEGLEKPVIVLDIPFLVEMDALGIVDFLVLEEGKSLKGHASFREKYEAAAKKLGKENVFTVKSKGQEKAAKEIWNFLVRYS